MHYFEDGQCAVCGNRGKFTRAEIKRANGERLESRILFCFCPNGQALRKAAREAVETI